MSASTSRLSYEDCFELLDMVLEKNKRIPFASQGDARHFRLRLHMARKVDRKENMLTYADNEDHPLYGRSVYDNIVVRLVQDGNKWWLYIKKMSLSGMKIEDIEDVIEPELLPATPQQLQITHQAAEPEPLSIPRRR